jgi:hypothetical protein
MGTLIAFRYPTNMMARLADHTYVACGTLGKAWGCWGGKTDGTELRRAPGSTKRADAIAEPNERGGITCYLVNGVCHQAANRILLPANITVQGARGYSVSSALFGTYGRPRGILGFCRAPFNRHAGVTGDLDECIEAARRDGGEHDTNAGEDDGDARERAFLHHTQELYAQEDVRMARADESDTDGIVRFQLALFAVFAEYKLAGDARRMTVEDERRQLGQLMEVREKTEHERLASEQRFVESGDVAAFARDDSELTLRFQAQVAKVLDPKRYQALLDLEPGDDVILADPEIMEHAYRRRPAPGF